MHSHKERNLLWKIPALFAFLFIFVADTAASLTLNAFDPNVGNTVTAIALQPDGKILIGGSFTNVATHRRWGIARLNPDGTLDSAFEAPAVLGSVYAMALQSDGKIVLGGNMGYYTQNGTTNIKVLRLNVDGSLDSTFIVTASGLYPLVHALAIQSDGKILMGGEFTGVNGSVRKGLARLNADGTVDAFFNPNPSGGQPYNYVSAFALQPDGKILVGGSFESLGGVPRSCIGRLSAGGVVDSFSPNVYGWVDALLVQPDGKIVVGGYFTQLADQNRRHLGRVTAEGELDTGFNPSPNGGIGALALQANGKILVGGSYTNLAGQRCHYIGRVNSNGSLDTAFGSGANDSVGTIAIGPDGKVFIGGSFTTQNGQPRNRIAGWNNSEVIAESLFHQGTNMVWQRTGACPEVWETKFDLSTTIDQWTHIGKGQRVSDGWQIAVTNLPPGSTLRARGFVSGSDSGSRWHVEKLIQIPTLQLSGPRRVGPDDFGFTITGPFYQTVIVEASLNFSQWSSLATNVLTNGTFEFRETAPASPRFYRARSF